MADARKYHKMSYLVTLRTVILESDQHQTFIDGYTLPMCTKFAQHPSNTFLSYLADRRTYRHTLTHTRVIAVPVPLLCRGAKTIIAVDL